MGMEVPTLDASCFPNASLEDQLKFADDLLDSLKKHGFVKLINHGISDEIVSEMFHENKKFFALSLEKKQQIAHRPGPDPQRGWSCIGSEKTSAVYEKIAGDGPPSNSADCKEHFDQGPANDEQFPNKWPSEADLPNFRVAMEKFYVLAEGISLQILQALEMALKLPADSFLSMMRHNASELRLNHYPAISLSDMREKNVHRTSPHFDLGVITLLFQDGIGGLEIQDRSRPGSFVPVNRQYPSEMIVNISETFQRWTNDEVLAGLHKVTIPDAMKDVADAVVEERFSVVYLCKADRNASVAPLKSFVVGGKEKYGHMSALTYHQERLGLAYQ